MPGKSHLDQIVSVITGDFKTVYKCVVILHLSFTTDGAFIYETLIGGELYNVGGEKR